MGIPFETHVLYIHFICLLSLGLCHENLEPSADGPQTLCGDLQGFWDMMMLQVDNIDASYADIQEVRENGWKVILRIAHFAMECDE